ncbi:core-binding factor subunit beta-like [Watersipora subatra]|uniref:core-binding factor subunit beta-like n=1 Tax=Watersipora subatra TaxID=2589382 RepID=UPI00355AEBF7
MYPSPRLRYQPRTYPDQRTQFENGDLFRKLTRESEVRYTGYRDCPLSERQVRFQQECREGHADIAFVSTGTNLALSFAADPWSDNPDDKLPIKETVDFDKEQGKVHLKSRFIMNGVCVVWKGWIDCNRLDGTGCLEFDEEKSLIEESLEREREEKFAMQLREFDQQQRLYSEQERQAGESENLRRMRRSTGIKLEQPL